MPNQPPTSAHAHVGIRATFIDVTSSIAAMILRPLHRRGIISTERLKRTLEWSLNVPKLSTEEQEALNAINRAYRVALESAEVKHREELIAMWSDAALVQLDNVEEIGNRDRAQLRTWRQERG